MIGGLPENTTRWLGNPTQKVGGWERGGVKKFGGGEEKHQRVLSERYR